MENNTLEVYFDKNIDLNKIYEIINRVTCYDFFCMSFETFNWLPKSISEFSKKNNYSYVIIYISDDGWPTLTISKNIFKNDLFFQEFKKYLNNIKYYLINNESKNYELIEYDALGKTGKKIII
ncbi:hypothetical protein [Acinetobacter gerneri]|uniref:hypothetical protein n=1 Tax=Acinetobacter gerneri TaxID=202952 RepID=UPI003A8ABF63